MIPRQTFNYYLTLTNNTSVTASPVNVTDNLPSNFTLVSVSLKIGNGPVTTLNATDYVISAGNIFSLPSASGPVVSVPANSTTIVSLTGYFS